MKSSDLLSSIFLLNSSIGVPCSAFIKLILSRHLPSPSDRHVYLSDNYNQKKLIPTFARKKNEINHQKSYAKTNCRRKLENESDC